MVVTNALINSATNGGEQCRATDRAQCKAADCEGKKNTTVLVMALSVEELRFSELTQYDTKGLEGI